MTNDISQPDPKLDAVKTRPPQREDIASIREVVRSSGNFTNEEVRTAIELVEESLAEGESSGYIVAVLEAGGKVQGYVCYGPTPLTDGVYDLYWIAVDARTQGKGYGRTLLQFAEEDIRRRGGRMIMIETSSQEKYGHTIRFYETAHYTLAARIRNFYKAGDDKLMYLKELQ